MSLVRPLLQDELEENRRINVSEIQNASEKITNRIQQLELEEKSDIDENVDILFSLDFLRELNEDITQLIEKINSFDANTTARFANVIHAEAQTLTAFVNLMEDFNETNVNIFIEQTDVLKKKQSLLELETVSCINISPSRKKMLGISIWLISLLILIKDRVITDLSTSIENNNESFLYIFRLICLGPALVKFGHLLFNCFSPLTTPSQTQSEWEEQQTRITRQKEAKNATQHILNRFNLFAEDLQNKEEKVIIELPPYYSPAPGNSSSSSS